MQKDEASTINMVADLFHQISELEPNNQIILDPNVGEFVDVAKQARQSYSALGVSVMEVWDEARGYPRTTNHLLIPLRYDWSSSISALKYGGHDIAISVIDLSMDGFLGRAFCSVYWLSQLIGITRTDSYPMNERLILNGICPIESILVRNYSEKTRLEYIAKYVGNRPDNSDSKGWYEVLNDWYNETIGSNPYFMANILDQA